MNSKQEYLLYKKKYLNLVELLEQLGGNPKRKRGDEEKENEEDEKEENKPLKRTRRNRCKKKEEEKKEEKSEFLLEFEKHFSGDPVVEGLQPPAHGNYVRHSYKANVDGLVGFELTLRHALNTEFTLTENAIIADYHTFGNTTKMVIAIEGGNNLFTSTDNFDIVDVVVGSAKSEIEYSISIVPDEFGLSNAYPNPFNPVTSVMLDMPQDGFASLKVYNLMGQVVATLHEGNLAAKTYTFNWNAAHMASGLYIVKAESANNVDLQKIMLMK